LQEIGQESCKTNDDYMKYKLLEKKISSLTELKQYKTQKNHNRCKTFDKEKKKLKFYPMNGIILNYEENCKKNWETLAGHLEKHLIGKDKKNCGDVADTNTPIYETTFQKCFSGVSDKALKKYAKTQKDKYCLIYLVTENIRYDLDRCNNSKILSILNKIGKAEKSGKLNCKKKAIKISKKKCGAVSFSFDEKNKKLILNNEVTE